MQTTLILSDEIVSLIDEFNQIWSKIKPLLPATNESQLQQISALSERRAKIDRRISLLVRESYGKQHMIKGKLD